MDSGAGTSTDRFRAFVSYANADSARAGRLQSRLETYRIPDTVGEVPALDGAGEDTVGPIFRDREDLSAAADLSEAVRDALAASQALVVVCTPNTRKSRWVSREIELFRSLHPDRPVLAALFEGEPKEAFPEALTAGGTEPLAADFRKSGDGDKLAFLKVVAGVLQVPLDRLIQRDAQRRVRRVTLVTAASLVLVLMMGAMTMFALQSRNEAQSQREEAEGLIDYMLTELRGDLRGVGNIKVMEGVTRRAMDYYEGQGDLDDLPDDSLQRRAELLRQMGEDEFNTVDPDRALGEGLFREAYRTTRSLYDRAPDDADRLFDHAQSSYWVGYSRYLQRDFAEAEQFWGEYRDLAERGMKAHPDDARWRLEIGYSHGSLCTLALHRDDVEADPIGVCRYALQQVEAAAKTAPDDPQMISALANRHGWMGDALKQAGDQDGSIAAYRRQHDLSEQLAKADPENAQRMDQLMRAKMVLAEALGAAGLRLESARSRNEALRMANEMVTRDPDNRHWRDWQVRLGKIEPHAR